MIHIEKTNEDSGQHDMAQNSTWCDVTFMTSCDVDTNKMPVSETELSSHLLPYLKCRSFSTLIRLYLEYT